MPSCRAPTSGPSATRVSGVSNAGVAAHITAASSGAARYDPTLTHEQRQDSANGLWLCQTHAKIIDDDESRFTPALLRAWRNAAEQRAGEELGRPNIQQGESRSLVSHSVVLPSDVASLSRAIDNFLTDIGGPIAWGNDYHLIRMLVYEIAINAFTHGGAHVIKLESEAGLVHLRDSGAAFSSADLRTAGRGGNRALRDFEEQALGTFFLIYRRSNGENTWSIIDEVLAEGKDVPCRVVLQGTGRPAAERALSDLRMLGNCDEVHFYASRLASYSDIYIIADQIRDELRGRKMWIHGIPPASPLRRVITEVMPTAVLAE